MKAISIIDKRIEREYIISRICVACAFIGILIVIGFAGSLEQENIGIPEYCIGSSVAVALTVIGVLMTVFLEKSIDNLLYVRKELIANIKKTKQSAVKHPLGTNRPIRTTGQIRNAKNKITTVS